MSVCVFTECPNEVTTDTGDVSSSLMFPFKSGGLCFKTQSSADEGAQCGGSSAVKWCALSQKDFEDKTNEFGNCGSFCFACSENDERLTNRRIAAY